MKTIATAILFAELVGAVGCYSLTPQDGVALQSAEALSAAAYCRLAREPDAGPNVAAARALQRGAHAEVAGVLRRSDLDAGGPDASVGCP